MKAIASALLPDGLVADVPARGWVVRSGDDLIDARVRAPSRVIEQMIQNQLAQYAKALQIEKVDLGKHMIIGVAAGTQASSKRSVHIERITLDAVGKVMTVKWKMNADSGADGSLSNPSEVVLVDRFDGQVKFDPAIEGEKAGSSPKPGLDARGNGPIG